MASQLATSARTAVVASDLGGLFTANQARREGWSTSALSRRVSTGEIHRVLPGVYTWAGHPLSWRGRAAAASLWAGADSALSFRTAAKWHGLTDKEELPFHVSLVGGGRPPIPDIKVHRVDEALLRDIIRIDGTSVTSARRTLLDLAGTKDPLFRFALDRALRTGKTSLQELAALVEARWVRGRRGIRILALAVEDRTPGLGPSDSDMETLFARIVLDHVLPKPQTQYPISFPGGVKVADFAYPEARLAIECDSKAWHMDEDAFDRDRLSDELLAVEGWQVLRFTWRRLRWESGDVAATVARIYSSRLARP
jgi:very-short-patch-repair endonuclease